MRISTRARDSSNSEGKSRDHNGSDVEPHDEREVGTRPMSKECSEVCN